MTSFGIQSFGGFHFHTLHKVGRKPVKAALIFRQTLFPVLLKHSLTANNNVGININININKIVYSFTTTTMITATYYKMLIAI